MKIEEGVAACRFGVVILSPWFFSKHWPERELNGLASREVNGKKVILPVWHSVIFEVVRDHSPILSDVLAVKTSEGLDSVVKHILGANRYERRSAFRTVDDFVLRKPPDSTNLNSVQQAARNRFNINQLRTTNFNRFQ